MAILPDLTAKPVARPQPRRVARFYPQYSYGLGSYWMPLRGGLLGFPTEVEAQAVVDEAKTRHPRYFGFRVKRKLVTVR